MKKIVKYFDGLLDRLCSIFLSFCFLILAIVCMPLIPFEIIFLPWDRYPLTFQLIQKGEDVLGPEKTF